MEQPPASPLTELEKVWLAAMIDGEGSVGIYRSKRANHKYGYRWSTTVSITNTNKDLMDRFAELSDCWVSRRRVNGGSAKNRPIHCVEIRYTNTRGFLEQILPYLIAKTKQAELVIDFCNMVRGPGQRYQDPQKMDQMYLRSRELNHRGTKPLEVEPATF